jgi:hypothetical protein
LGCGLVASVSVIIVIIIISVTVAIYIKRQHYFLDKYNFHEWLTLPPPKKIKKEAEKFVKIHITPESDYNFDIMKPGVLQHIDRQYTYDVIPPDLLNGFLFQGVHRPPKGTIVTIELFFPAKIFFFFHHSVDGGYSEIFKKLQNWERSPTAPQYDIHDGTHGLKMIMYQLEATTGTYIIPPTTKEKACFNIVIKVNNNDSSQQN